MTTDTKCEYSSVIVKVRHASSAGDFLPFTALPKRFHGKRVRVTIVEDDCSTDGTDDSTDGVVPIFEFAMIET